MHQVEFDFTLPRGYIDPRGSLHRSGVMRLATTRDELDALHDRRVKDNPEYLPVLILARVVVQLGSLERITTDVILDLFSQDYQFLQALYVRLNSSDEETDVPEVIETSCPQCGAALELDLSDFDDAITSTDAAR
ncbi:MAG TPA: hypothetical protein VKT77_07755 [Chthonomonadaceae bacterium]|nr:hypothetical protein [Chthonomonadaceae bacterium]